LPNLRQNRPLNPLQNLLKSRLLNLLKSLRQSRTLNPPESPLRNPHEFLENSTQLRKGVSH
jgi:hypothetical protein